MIDIGNIKRYLENIYCAKQLVDVKQIRPEECAMYDESNYYPNITEYVANKMKGEYLKGGISNESKNNS